MFNKIAITEVRIAKLSYWLKYSLIYVEQFSCSNTAHTGCSHSLLYTCYCKCSRLLVTCQNNHGCATQRPVRSWQLARCHIRISAVGYLFLSPAHGAELRGSDVYLNILETLSGNFSLNSTRLRALGLPLHDFFFIDCSKPLGESVGLKGMYSISGLRYFLQSGL